jgi:hypothetical protein
MPKFIIYGSLSSALSFAIEGRILIGCDSMKRCLSAVYAQLCLDMKIRFQDVFLSAGSCARPVQELGANLSEQLIFQTESFDCVGNG